MQHSYKNAMNKISADSEYAQKLKQRLERERQRVDSAPVAPASTKTFRIIVSAATAAVLLLTVISASMIMPRFLAVVDKNAVNDTVYDDSYTDVELTRGYNTITLAQDLSYRFVSKDDAIDYNTNIHFKFEGFDKYNIQLRESCIVFVTSLSPSYTLANFFDDYYKLIVNGNGISELSNGLLQSMFGIGENDLRTISVHDDSREILNLETTYMSEYSGMDDIYFTVSIT